MSTLLLTGFGLAVDDDSSGRQDYENRCNALRIKLKNDELVRLKDCVRAYIDKANVEIKSIEILFDYARYRIRKIKPLKMFRRL